MIFLLGVLGVARSPVGKYTDSLMEQVVFGRDAYRWFASREEAGLLEALPPLDWKVAAKEELLLFRRSLSMCCSLLVRNEL